MDLAGGPQYELADAIRAWRAVHPDQDTETILERARGAARIALSRGVTAMRTHVDVGTGIGLRAAEA